jgi:hypothetical protein
MNRRDFVRKSVGVVVAGSLISGEERLAAQSSAQTADKKALSPANWTIAGKEIRVNLGDDGTIRALQVNSAGQWEGVEFRQGVLAGPAWAGVKMGRVEGPANSFAGVVNGVRHLLGYRLDGNRLAIVATLKNEGLADYSPKAARLVLGINCEMRSYPSWDFRYFPTLLRCEKTHFWGYFMTPKGRIMTIGSPAPVASYSFNYDEAVWSHGDGGAPLKDDSEFDVWKHGYVDGGHLIFTSSLDVLHALPLPPRHPQNLVSLKPGEERAWTIYLEPVGSVEEVKPALAASLAAPMIDADRYTVAAGETSRLTVWAPKDVKADVTLPDGGSGPLTLHSIAKDKFAVEFVPQAGPGLYKITVTQSDGHVSEASVSVRHPWAWYINQARKDTLVNKQYASSHLEQWLGLETDVLARLYLPDSALDAKTDKRLKEILNLQWDLAAKKPSNIPIEMRHLVNTAQMAAILAWRYRSDRDPYWLDLASGFADYVVSRQATNGDYDKYTVVAYPVKAVMTVMAAEKTMAATDSRYKAAYDRHYASARRAIDFLVRSEDDLVTEGENTFEDGMISCAALQLGLFALLQKDTGERRRYAEASRKMLLSHRCLEQLLIPDSRMNGATLRFWEAQYDTLIGKSRNMMDSPHGWSAWLIPALWYQYLLTGEEMWLRKAMNSMGSCAQLIDSQTGQLRWAFVPDPYREVTMLEPNPANPQRGKRVDRIIGEQYVPMVAAFHYPDHEPVCGNGWDSGWTCCNDVHEVFTSMAEMALTSAYVIERENGELGAWNCKATLDSAGGIDIQPAEEVVVRVHLNLLRPHQVKATFADAVAASAQAKGMHWIGPGGEPELIRS